MKLQFGILSISVCGGSIITKSSLLFSSCWPAINTVHQGLHRFCQCIFYACAYIVHSKASAYGKSLLLLPFVSLMNTRYQHSYSLCQTNIPLIPQCLFPFFLFTTHHTVGMATNITHRITPPITPPVAANMCTLPASAG